MKKSVKKENISQHHQRAKPQIAVDALIRNSCEQAPRQQDSSRNRWRRRQLKKPMHRSLDESQSIEATAERISGKRLLGAADAEKILWLSAMNFLIELS